MDEAPKIKVVSVKYNCPVCRRVSLASGTHPQATMPKAACGMLSVMKRNAIILTEKYI